MTIQELTVVKANGDQVLFSVEKLRESMRRSGADKQIIEKVIDEIAPQLFEGITTKKIYQMAFNLLKKGSKSTASRYKLKKALMEIGPSGFPFERFVAELFRKKGYKTQTSIIVQGACVTHEIDVIATTESEQFMIECKYHSLAGKLTDVKVPLYIHSRFRDVLATWKANNKINTKELSGWIVTNTRFSDDALQYGKCADLHLLGWDYPMGKGIKDIIDEHKVYPITCLTGLTKAEKEQILAKEIVFCDDLSKNKQLLFSIGLSEKRINGLETEINNLREVHSN